MLFLIALLALVDEGFAARKHEVHHPGELVGHRSVGGIVRLLDLSRKMAG
jgi:hypothetical protein